MERESREREARGWHMEKVGAVRVGSGESGRTSAMHGETESMPSRF
jgi:hypothetical protein